MDFQQLNLGSLATGAAGELFNRELERVLRDMMDPNTSESGVRSVTFELKLKPSKEGEVAATQISVRSSVPKPEPVAGTVFFGVEGGRAVAYARNPKQERMDFDGPKVVEGGGGQNQDG